MSEGDRITRVVRLSGRLKKLGLSVEIDVPANATTSTLRSAVARAVRSLGDDARASLVGVSILVTEKGVLGPDEVPSPDAVLTILPPPCS